jgi:hypothetical protein
MTTKTTSSPTSRASWLHQAGWGLMFHYLDRPASSNVVSATTAEEWNRRVDGFRVDHFARQVKETGAGYVIFTLGQNSGHFCTPNATYDEITGIRPSRLSRRDLIAEIAEALSPDVRLIAYLPSHAPANDAAAVAAFRLVPSWDAGAWGLPAPAPDAVRGDDRLGEFQRKWEAVVAEWGNRWGDKVVGWWIDGCYFADRMYKHPDEPNASSFSAALRAGNPDRILAFNTGTANPFDCVTPEQDYTAGEVTTRFPASNKWESLTRKAAPLQLHLLSHLGDWWGEGRVRFPDAWVSEYTALIRKEGGVVTWDVPIENDGSIVEAFRGQIAQAGSRVW